MIRKIISVISCAIFLTPSSPQAANIKNDGDYVVILHGIARSHKHMKKLANYLEANGFDVINLDYPSTTHKIEKLTQILGKKISEKVTEDKPLHLVGYSMGGLMTRALIHKYNYKNLGRVVQLAPPNQGSEIADFLKNFWPYKKIFGPAGQQLITDQSAVQDIFGEVTYELGIIAGNATIDPVSSAIIPGENDGKVAVERTKLEGMADHITVNASHTFFPYNKEVWFQTLFFIQNGNFKR
jgi:triacylglycerol esterase/lipase EstA (alpha/beta hydrolase family)